MPYLNLKTSRPLNDDESNQIGAALTGLTASILHKKPEVTAVTIETVADDRWHIGSAPLSQQSFYLSIKITHGTNNAEEKSRFIAEVFKAIEAHLGQQHPASYITIEECAADSWGYHGKTQAARIKQLGGL